MLLSCEEFVDNPEELRWALLAWVVSRSGNGNDLHLRQYFLEFFLCRRRHNCAAPAQDIDDWSFDFAHEAPEFGRHETVADSGIPFPDDSAVCSWLRSVMHIVTENVVRSSRICSFLLREKLIFRRPS